MKVYAILWHKIKKENPKPHLYDLLVFNKRSDAKKYLKDILKDLDKEDRCTNRKDGDGFIVSKIETGEDYYFFIQDLDLR